MPSPVPPSSTRLNDSTTPSPGWVTDEPRYLRLRRAAPTWCCLILELSRIDGRARNEVTDDGAGIPPARRAEVLARFHLEAGSRGDGYGLGLSIVQRVAQLHGADIALLDAPCGHGLRIQITFPREED